ncbi:hypothetical protein JWG42_01975 [Desulfoprunum benzoelyticum]|uniref:Uncharacterized protein n=1 Tax=Desulfoprunum benzoelyticum TaxID=1506996 RepID=A0A840V006_9BACT|nr:hypothetical protein [Desulfoprunum benzoelyticum]MBB5346551.1 hypothetical protein [Desulfoprunum benzoelyticum]MBM9528920.1 hypothetical protein [Desulfoprunum benzoelyticum]
MDYSENDPAPRPRRRKRSPWKFFLLLLLILALLVGAFAFVTRNDPRFSLNRLIDRSDRHTASPTVQPPSADTAKTVVMPGQTPPAQDEPATAEPGTAPGEDNKPAVAEADDGAGEDSGLTEEELCSRESAKLEAFYTHLDQQPYIKSFKLTQPSREHFSGLFRKLAAQPPIVSRETDDLYTILKNTAHFFRVIGKDNILLIKGILDQEKESYEDIVASLYRLTGHPDCLQSRLGLQIPESVYYDYSGFFLNTMGGRLYLFRRDSKSRMIVNYYAILVVDRANQNGTNSHGIDIRPAISSLISDIESGGAQLKLRETYLDQLYALKEKYPEPVQ